MNKLLFVILLALPISGFAQSVNGIPIKDIDVEYMQIVGTSKLLSNKLTIEIDFGQENKVYNSRDTQLRDSNNKKIEFNSMVDALNFMVANGYEFVTAYTVTMSNNSNVYHFLLRKKR